MQDYELDDGENLNPQALLTIGNIGLSVMDLAH
jgi:hypothetical protein